MLCSVEGQTPLKGGGVGAGLCLDPGTWSLACCQWPQGSSAPQLQPVIWGLWDAASQGRWWGELPWLNPAFLRAQRSKPQCRGFAPNGFHNSIMTPVLKCFSITRSL